MNVKQTMVAISAILSFSAAATETVDVLFMVEPSVFDTLKREEVGALIEQQIATANALHAKEGSGITYRASAVIDWSNNEVSEKLAQGKSFAESVGQIMYSVRYDEATFYQVFENDPWFKNFESKAHDEFRKYHADNFVFISNQSEVNTRVIGYAFQNFGLVASVGGMQTTDRLLAHEWGHNIGLGHTSADECSKAAHLMCADASDNAGGFTVDEMERVNGVVAKDSNYFVDHYDSAFYLGWYSEPQQKTGKVVFSVLDNPIQNTLDTTEAVVELVDAQGAPQVFDKEVSIEVFTKAGTASAGTNYDSDVYQRLVFAPGESTKRLDLGVTHGTSDLNFKMGARYGLSLNDSNVVDVTILAKADSNNGNNGGDNNGGDSSSGGSLGFISLLLLACLGRYRR